MTKLAIDRPSLKKSVKDLLFGKWWRDTLLYLGLPMVLLQLASDVMDGKPESLWGLDLSALAEPDTNISLNYTFSGIFDFLNQLPFTGEIVFFVMSILAAIPVSFVVTLVATSFDFSAFDDVSDQRVYRDWGRLLQVFTAKQFLMVIKISLWQMLFTTLWTFLLVIPGVIKAYSYGQALYLYKDDVAHGAKVQSALAYVRESQKLMNGRKWERFVLDLSFIGWELLAALIPFRLGYLALGPYMSATFAQFYLEIRDEREVKSTVL